MEIEIYHVDQAINGSKEALGAIIENIEWPMSYSLFDYDPYIPQV